MVVVVAMGYFTIVDIVIIAIDLPRRIKNLFFPPYCRKETLLSKG